MISDNLKQVYKNIHNVTPFGKRSKFPKYLESFIESVNPKSVLDFGCGKGRLLETIKERFPNIKVRGYDPANPDYENNIDDVFVDLLISSDVLEHVEPEYIDQTLDYLKTKSKYIFHLIALSPAKLILPDGRNAHLIIESKEWWRDKFVKRDYNILNEHYIEYHKTPKGSKTPMLMKKYFIMAERQ
jgi:cyclopropane fatty-acyl-phospholipid synthase-like methyltransferase